MSLSLRVLPDDVLLSRIRTLVGRERAVTIAVLDHLAEIRRRELHLRLGYPSLFAYCTDSLGYSSSAAGRRIQAAVCLARFPEVRALLESGEVNVCTLAMVSRVLTPANHLMLLARIRGKSQREVQAIVAEHDPWTRVPRDRITPVAITKPVANGSSLTILPTIFPVERSAGEVPASAVAIARAVDKPAARVGAAATCESGNYSRSGSESSPVERPASTVVRGGAASSVEIMDATRSCEPGDAAMDHVCVAAAVNSAGRAESLDPRVRIQFTASRDFMAQLERVRAIASNRLPVNASLEQVFALSLRYFIEREDPVKRHQRRERRAVLAASRRA